MRLGGEYLAYRKLLAPRESGTGLFEPDWEGIENLVEENVQGQDDACYDVQRKCLSQLAREAKKELLDAARRWTASYRDVGDWAPPDSGLVFLAGHQPQMFHPGVWLKNFALSRLAEQRGAVAVNLIVDSDTIRSHAITVPGGTVEQPTVAGPVVPFEERRIIDPAVFASFAGRVYEQIRPLVPQALVGQYWRHVQDRARQTDRLGLCLAQGRHLLEGQWGCRTLELPQSAVCDLDSYRWFACHVLDQAARFRQVHNQAVAEYRHIHHIRSAAHPVADLAEQDGWQEAPFWIWSCHQPRRRRLFVRRTGDSLRLTDRGDLDFSLPLPAGGDASRAVECLQNHGRNGICLRSRALITTMWARLALGNLFVHGIGGAKYDQVTDAIIAQFFGIKPPAYVTVSGTLHLPVSHRHGEGDDLRDLQERLRRLEYQPERFLKTSIDPDGASRAEAGRLVEEKWSWITRDVTAENHRERFLAIRRLNGRLRHWIEPIREETSRALERAEQRSRAAAILARREYAFCLFPGEAIQEFFSRLLPKRA